MRPIATSANGSREPERLVRVAGAGAAADHGAHPNGHVALTRDARLFRIRWGRQLTIASAAALCHAVRDALREDIRQLWIDLRAVAAIDVVGLAALLQSARAASSQAVEFSVTANRTVHTAMLQAQLLDEIRVTGRVADDPTPDPADTEARRTQAAPLLARGQRLGLRQPTREELTLFERWGREPLLERMVGSQLLYVCRHLGPHHPGFASLVLNDPTSLTLLIEPHGADTPVGFVRVYGVHLVEQFAFLETAVADLHGWRKGWGIEASRLLLAYGMDVLGLRRVEAKVYAYNRLSVNALARNGFHREGTLRQARTCDGQRWDILLFSILQDEMLAERQAESFPYMGLWPPR